MPYWTTVSYFLYHDVLIFELALAVIEFQAINEVFAGSHREETPPVPSTPKKIFGHIESSAGLLGTAKVLQQFRHGTVPGIALLSGGTDITEACYYRCASAHFDGGDELRQESACPLKG